MCNLWNETSQILRIWSDAVFSTRLSIPDREWSTGDVKDEEDKGEKKRKRLE